MASPPEVLRSVIRATAYAAAALLIATPMLDQGTLYTSVAFYLPLLLLCLFLLRLEKSGKAAVAAWILCLTIFTAVFSGVYLFGGIRDQTAISFGTLIAVAALTIGGRGTIVFGTLSAAAVFVLVKAEQHDFLPQPLKPISTNAMLSAILLNLAVIAAVLQHGLKAFASVLNQLNDAHLAREDDLARLEELQRKTEERAESSRKIAEIGEQVVHGEIGVWRPRVLEIIRELFGARATSFFESPAGSDPHLTAWCDPLCPGTEESWKYFKPEHFPAEGELYSELSTKELSPLGDSPLRDIQSALFVSIPGRNFDQGVVAILFEHHFGLKPGFEEDLLSLRSILGSAMERSVVEQKMRVAQRLETVGRLAGSIAHDFNNLLTTVTTCSDLLLESKRTEPDDVDLLEDISRAADHAALLTRQLLTLSRGQIVLESPISMDESIRNFCGIADRMVGEQISIRFDSNAPDALILADPASIEQIFLNLAVNAREAMPRGGSIRIALDSLSPAEALEEAPDLLSKGSLIRVKFSDNGSGIPSDVLEHLFEPFFTTRKSGTGLGLATVKQAISELNGDIRVCSIEGMGSQFTVYLPTVLESPKEKPAAKEETRYLASGEEILLVEDNDYVRKTIERVLSEAGYRVTLAHDGQEAWNRMRVSSENSFDAILTDIMMPNLSGTDFVSRVRRNGDATPVLFMSGFSDSEHGEIGSLGDFIAKPFSTIDLLRQLHTIRLQSAP